LGLAERSRLGAPKGRLIACTPKAVVDRQRVYMAGLRSCRARAAGRHAALSATYPARHASGVTLTIRPARVTESSEASLRPLSLPCEAEFAVDCYDLFHHLDRARQVASTLGNK